MVVEIALTPGHPGPAVRRPARAAAAAWPCPRGEHRRLLVPHVTIRSVGSALPPVVEGNLAPGEGEQLSLRARATRPPVPPGPSSLVPLTTYLRASRPPMRPAHGRRRSPGPAHLAEPPAGHPLVASCTLLPVLRCRPTATLASPPAPPPRPAPPAAARSRPRMNAGCPRGGDPLAAVAGLGADRPAGRRGRAAGAGPISSRRPPHRGQARTGRARNGTAGCSRCWLSRPSTRRPPGSPRRSRRPEPSLVGRFGPESGLRPPLPPERLDADVLLRGATACSGPGPGAISPGAARAGRPVRAAPGPSTFRGPRPPARPGRWC